MAPDQQQAHGEWTEEEHAAFLALVKEHGAGDRWGIFATHIPQRVGYQCASYYRDVVVASGAVFDPRYRMQRNGKAVFGA